MNMKKIGKLVLSILGYALLFCGISFSADILFGRPLHFQLYLIATAILCGYLEFRSEEKEARVKECR